MDGGDDAEDQKTVGLRSLHIGARYGLGPDNADLTKSPMAMTNKNRVEDQNVTGL